MEVPDRMKQLPTSDEFILHCERIRAENYRRRAQAVAELGSTHDRAGWARFGNALVWFSGERARVHWIDEADLGRMDLIERWLDERKLNALFDVVPTLANRGITVALSERGYRTRYSSGTTTVTHSLSRGESFCRA